MGDPAKLLQAIEANDVAAVQVLLAAEPTLASARSFNGVSALMYAVYRGQQPIVTAITQLHPDLDIFEAAAIGNAARVKQLLAENPNLVCAWSADGATALHFACFFRQPEIAKILIDAGSDVQLPAKGFGWVTPLHSAVAGRSPEAVEMLLVAGADANAVQQGGFTPLHSAANNGDARCVRLLLDHGADATRTSDDGKSPAEMAESHGDVAAMLTRHRAARASS